MYLSFFKSLNITRRSSTVTSKNESGSSPSELNVHPLLLVSNCQDRECHNTRKRGTVKKRRYIEMPKPGAYMAQDILESDPDVELTYSLQINK